MANGLVDPALVPQKILYTGAKMPAIGLGTFGSDHVSASEVAAAVEGGGGRVGYRHFDCASVYGNEAQVGHALGRVLRRRVGREAVDDLQAVERQARRSRRNPVLRQSLADLNWITSIFTWSTGRSRITIRPVAMYVSERGRQTVHPRGLHEDLAPDGGPGGARAGAAYRDFEHDRPQAHAASRDARIKPAVNEMELHPHFQQPEFFGFVGRRASSRSATAP